MRILGVVDRSSSSLMREEELLRQLQATGVCTPGQLRLTIADRRLFLDGFVQGLDQKFLVERACRQLSPTNVLVNRLRVAPAEEYKAS